MPTPADYVDRVYAGVLGKLIGVYLGRPFENWSHEAILRDLGPIEYYVHERRGVRSIVEADDDISGTFTFIRALEDYGTPRDLTSRQIGQTWLNYIIENRTILWWGGMGMSTEHTAFLRLKHGIPAPRSGSIELNGKIVAEQIGAQIFIDGWAMVAPGDPELAVDFAAKAARVSHDGEAVYGAQVVAAIESLAFVESDIHKLIDAAVRFIPEDSVIYRMIADLRHWRQTEPDWKKALALLAAGYGYDKYGGNCHMVPNHGVIILALLWGEDDFQKSLMVANTSGWDTDCNSGNVGCIMGIKNGLHGINAGPDWRSPVADRLFVPTADGGGAVTDAVTQTFRLANMGRTLAGEKPLAPKMGARFHFSLPGSVQGFVVESSPEARGAVRLRNTAGALEIICDHLAPGRVARVATATFIPPEQIKASGYNIVACPTLYPGQTVRAAVSLKEQTFHRADNKAGKPPLCRLYLRAYGQGEELTRTCGPEVSLTGRASQELSWKIPDVGGAPIAEIGIEIVASSPMDVAATLDYLTWDGAPDVVLRRPASGSMYMRAWVEGVSAVWWGQPGETCRIMQNEGRGLLIQGTRQWTDYRAEVTLTPHLADAAGLAVRVQGMQRYYALLLNRPGTASLVKALDGLAVLAQAPMAWEFAKSYTLALAAKGRHLRASIDGKPLFDVEDGKHPFHGGAVALVCQEGRCAAGDVTIAPL